MEEKKVLNNEQLEKVSGGYMTDWQYLIERRCPICGENWFDTSKSESDARIPVDSPCHPGNTLEVISVKGFWKQIW